MDFRGVVPERDVAAKRGNASAIRDSGLEPK